MLKLTEQVGITIFLLYKQKPGEILIFRTFIAKFWIFFFWIFAYFSQKIDIFRSGMFLWRHNYVMPWSIVLILVCMDRSISTYWYQNQGRGLPPLVKHVTNNSLVTRGLKNILCHFNQLCIGSPLRKGHNGQFFGVIFKILKISSGKLFEACLCLSENVSGLKKVRGLN